MAHAVHNYILCFIFKKTIKNHLPQNLFNLQTGKDPGALCLTL